jgi:hypothetical protein
VRWGAYAVGCVALDSARSGGDGLSLSQSKMTNPMSSWFVRRIINNLRLCPIACVAAVCALVTEPLDFLLHNNRLGAAFLSHPHLAT